MNAQDKSPESSDGSRLRGSRILIVEDELLVALETKALIWHFGGIVVGPYARVPAALAALQTHAVDAAVLDVNLAGTQSFVIADALAERNLPFIFCSGYGREIMPPRFATAAMLEKPLIPEELIDALVEALAARAAPLPES